MGGAIFTIGYGKRSVEDVIDLLRREAVQYLIDVRSSPRSKFNPGFSAEPLQEVLRNAGIRYVFMGDSLGGRPNDLTCYESGHVIYDRVRARPFFQEGIRRLLRAIEQNLNVCLLCSESRPEDCHRSKLIGFELDVLGTPVTHLGAQGERLSQADVLAVIQSVQGDLFGSSLRSRRTYRPAAMVAGREGEPIVEP